jgi:hypothetical protein
MLKGNLDFKSLNDSLVLWFEINTLFILDNTKNCYVINKERLLFIHSVMIKHSITIIKYDNINVCFDDLNLTLDILVFKNRFDCQATLLRSPIPFHLVTLDEENPIKETTTFSDTLLETYKVSRYHLRHNKD